MSQASAKGARSTALHSLQWVLGILLSAIPVCAFIKTPAWVIIFVSSAVAVCLVTFIGAYIYLLFNNPDALRSETFTLSKMAIEKGLIGDSLAGLHQAQTLKENDCEKKSITSDQGVIE